MKRRAIPSALNVCAQLVVERLNKGLPAAGSSDASEMRKARGGCEPKGTDTKACSLLLLVLDLLHGFRLHGQGRSQEGGGGFQRRHQPSRSVPYPVLYACGEQVRLHGWSITANAHGLTANARESITNKACLWLGRTAGRELPTGNYSFKDIHETVPSLIAQGWSPRLSSVDAFVSGASEGSGSRELFYLYRAFFYAYNVSTNPLKHAYSYSAGSLNIACAEEGVSKFIHVSALGACSDSPSEFYRSKAAGEVAVKAAFPSASIGDSPLIMLQGWDPCNKWAGSSPGIYCKGIFKKGVTNTVTVYRIFRNILLFLI
eukprot:1196172-Prorocentrum_minimum.AAC.3